MLDKPVFDSQPERELISITVPVPPSVNQLYKNVPKIGRVKTKHYVNWMHEAGWKLKLQRPGRIGGAVMMIVSVEHSWDRGDIDNRVKPLFDLLVRHNVIDDDSKVVGFSVAWAPARDDEARVLIFPARDCTVQFQLSPDGRHGGWFLLTDTPSTEGDD